MTTRRWPAALHGGQAAILMAVLTAVGYGGMSLMAPVQFNAQARADGGTPSVEGWWYFAGAIALIGLAHGLGYAWQRGRKLNDVASLCLALWLPTVVGFWSGRSLPGALKAQVAWHERNPRSFGEDYAESNKRSLAYDSVYLQYSEILLLSGVAGLVLLFFWFGGRRKKADDTP